MADNNQYKILLGTKLDTSDIQDQVTAASKSIKPIELKIDAETKELTNTIKEALNSLSKGTEGALKIDTSKIETSLDKLSDVIKDIRTSLGTLDSGDMKSLVSSINQMAKALGKAENESDSLVKSLTALSKKDLSINFGFNMGKSASQVASEQGDIKRNAISQLKQQAKALEVYLDQYYKVAQQGEGVVKLTQGTNLFNVFWEMSPNIGDTKASLKQQVDTYKQYIHLMQEAAKIKGVDLSGITSGFSKTTDDIVKETSSAANGVEQLTQAFKGLFGSGIDVEGLSASLEPIAKDLTEIREAVVNLSKGISLEGLTQSFDRLSDTIEKLVSNVTLAKTALRDGLGSVASTTASTINLDDVIDKQAMKLMNEYAITGSKAFDEIRQSLVDFRNGSGDINKVTSAISNNMKVVNDAKNDYKELAEYIKMFNASGAKVHIPDSIRQEYGEDYKSMRSQLGKGFTSGQGMDFETFVTETNEILGQTIDLSHGAEAAFGDLVDKVNSTKGGKFLTGDDLFKNGILDMGDVVANVSTSLEQIEKAEEEIARTSTSAANTVVKNEERKQQEYQETKRLISDIAKESIDNVTSKSIDRSFTVDDSDSLKFRREMEKLVSQWTDAKGELTDIKIDTTTVFDKDAERNIERIRQAQVTYNNELGETIKKTIALRQIGTEKNTVDKKEIVTPVYGYVEVAGQYSKTLGKTQVQTDKFVKQQKRAVTDLTNQINQLNRAATDQNANRPIKDSSHLDTLKSKYQEIIAAIQKMGNASNATFDDERNEVKRLISEYKSLKSEFKNAENVSMDFKGADFASGLEIAKNRLREFKADAKGFSQVTQTVEQLDRAIEGVGDKSSLDKFNDQLKVAKSELKAVKAEVLSENDNLATKIKIDIESEKFENKVSQLHNQLDQLTDVDGSLDKLRASIKQVDDAYDAMTKATDDESLIQAQKRFAAAVEKTNNELKIQAREQRAANNAAKLADSKAALKTDMLNWLKKNSKATKEYKAEIDRLIASLDKLDQDGVNGVRRRFSNIDRDAELKGLKGLNFFDSMKSKIKEYSVYFGAAEMFMYAEQGLRSMFEQVKLIDSAMTELKKVTNETDAAYDEFLTNAADRARVIGTTIDGLVSSTADFARLGYGFEDAQGLAEVANIYAVVGDEINGVEGATESLISTMAAFKAEANGLSESDFALSIVDKMNEVSNNFAISSGGLGEALKRSASAMYSSNNTLDETIALITASNTVVQDADVVGNAYKTIALRIRGAKSELEEMGEDTSGMAESSAKLRDELLAISGVDILEADGKTFKSTYDILNEISMVYKDLSDLSQANILEKLAGKRQANILSAALENFDIARDALETSMNSSGSALEEHSKWQKSLEADLCLDVWKQAS